MYINKLLTEASKLLTSGKFNKAELNYKKIIKLDPDNIIALNNLGHLFLLQKKYNDALILLDRLLKTNPKIPEALNNKGNCLQELGHYDDALECFKKAFDLKPNYVEAIYNQGICLNKLNRYDEALICYQKTLNLKPDFYDALVNQGECLNELNRYDESLASSQKALDLKPDLFEAFNNKGNSLKMIGRYDEALISYKKALELKPDFYEALNNQGSSLRKLGRYDEALTSFQKAIYFEPNYFLALNNLGHLQLTQGNFKAGWKNYEYRKKIHKKKYLTFNTNIEWIGDKDLKDKTIFISKEQGLGDYIQFCRYLPVVKELGAKIILNTPQSLTSMIDSMNLDYTDINKLNMKEINYHCSIVSLPLAFGTSIDTIPNKTPYFFTPKDKLNFWKQKLKNSKSKKIGIKWTGSKSYGSEDKRSINLEQLKTLFDLPYEFHSLEIEYSKNDEKLLKEIKNFHCHKNEIIGFDSTAGLIEAMDVIISVDTSIAHLCGAINKSVWILLAFDPDFRWLLYRNDSPWYPSAKLYRQTKLDDWDSVVKNIKNDIIK